MPDARQPRNEDSVTARLWGRLLGYEQPEETGPWLLVVLARWLVRRHVRRLPWSAVRIGDPA